MARLPPNPALFKDTGSWAKEFYDFFLSETRYSQANDPLPVLLPHKTRDERAAVDGILLYDPNLGEVVVSKDGLWRSTNMDFNAFLAEQEVRNTYGDTVSVVEKKKTLLKFGNNADIDTGDNFATVWQLGKEAGTESEVYVASGTNPIDSISSTDVGDTEDIAIEGHISNGLTGADEAFTFATETVTLNGQTRVALSNNYARISRASVIGASPTAGDVYVYENTALTSGKPTDITKAHISIEGTNGETQSFKAATTFSFEDYFFLTKAVFNVKKGSGTAVVDFRVMVRQPGSVFRPLAGVITLGSNQPAFEYTFTPYSIIPKNSDIRIEASTNTNNTTVSASFLGMLAKVVA